MSEMKRQSSWQEDIARNFSRLFLRSKSQEPQKTRGDGSDTSSNVKDDEPRSPSAELLEGDPPQELLLDLSKAFRGSEGEREEAAEVGEEEEEEEEKEEEGEGSSVLDDAGGSPSRPPSSSPPRSPSAPGPGTPTAPLDVFFRKLGSLFHLSSKAEAGSAEPLQTAAAEETPTDPDAPGATWEGGRETSDPSGRPLGEADADRPLREGQEMDGQRGEGGAGGGEGESGEALRTPADSEALFTRRPAQTPTQHGQSDLQGPQDLVLDEEAGKDCGVACGVGAAEEDDEERRRLALSCPPVVTYGTYRGFREIKKIRRRNRLQVDSPISEGEEMQQGAKLSPPGRRTRGAAASEHAGSSGEGSRALAGDAGTATPAGPGLGGVPVTMPSENSVSQSALPREQQPDPARARGQTTADSCPGALSAAISLSTAQKESSDKQPSPAVAENKAHRIPAESSEERTTWAMAETVAEAKKAGTEWSETLSVRQGSTGSPSKAGDALPGKAGGAQGTALMHQPVAGGDAATQSRNHGSQLDSRCVSLSGTQEAEDSEGPVPADRGSNAQETALAAGKSQSEILAAGMGSIEDTGPDEEALWFESRRMVDNILRNALVALQNIESRERENRDEEAIVPDGSFKVERLQQGGLSEPADSTRLPVSVEQGLGLSGASMEGNRSALSSGYESIVGSDTDIRNSLGFSSDLGSVGVSVSISDQRQGKQCPVERPQALHPAELCESYSGDYSSCRSEETDPQSDGNIKFVLLITGESDASISDNKGDHCIPSENKLLSFSVGNLEADNGEVTRISNNVSEPPDSISGKVNKANLQTYQVSSDPLTGAISTEARGEAISKDLHFAKDRTESNSKSHNLTSSSKEIVPSHQQDKVHGDLEMPKVDPEKPSKFNGVKNESALSIQLARNTMDTKTFQREAQSKDIVQHSTFAKLELKSIDEQQILPTGSEPSQSSEGAPIQHHPTENEAIMDCMGKSKVLQDRAEAGLNSCDDVCQMDRNGTRDLQELCDDERSAGDQSFALVESYLATVVEDELESGVEGSTSSRAGPGRADANGKRETPEEPERRESPVSCTALGSDDDDAQQWRAVKAYRCHVLAEEGQGSEAQERGAGPSFREDVSSRSSGHGAASKRTHPDLSLSASRGEPSGPYIHRFHEMDFHECEGGFAIINEEEEADAVFVNDTGAMLSPTTRRSKAYPFSLSPIFEEESGREEVLAGDLHEPPVTEEDLRSVEQQASSILSLLQSVSERLQSSSFLDPYRDSEDLSPTLQQPPWGGLSDRVGEGQDALPRSPSDGREAPPHWRPLIDETDSFGTTDRRAGGTQVAPLGRGEDPRFPSRSDFTAVSNSPFYEYLKSARCHVPQPDADDIPPHSEVKLCQGDEGTSAPVLTGVCKNSEKVVPRPTQVHIYSGVTFSGEKREFHADVEDATGMAFPRGASVRVLRGCWLLYREPGFKGPCVVLEEGETVLSQAGGLSCPGSSPTAVAIGSIRRVVKDHGAPEILIRPQDARGGTLQRLCAAADNLGARGSVRLSSLTVTSGCWVAYEDAGFDGNYTVLEAGGPVTPGPDGHLVTCVRSLRPLRMGGLKVQRPTDPKMVVYEQPCFGGQSRELGDHTPNLGSRRGLRAAASLRVVGGVWVGYSAEGYKGRQYLLEEGEYRDCLELGGSDQTLLSFRFLQADFIEPSISLRSGPDLPHATETDVADLDVPDLEQAGSAGKTDSICVRSGVWVAYSGRSFCGKQCVLEKGTHVGDLDWGGTTGVPASIRPVRLERFGSGEPRFLIQAYSQPHYQGDSKEYDTEVQNCIVPLSFRVIRGSWLLFEGEGCAGNQFVLGEGLYPDLISCGCVATSIKSFKPIPHSFSDPSISLYSLESFEGLETIALTHKDSMNNFFTQSVRVNSGLWVVYEYGHFKGRQMLLHSGEFATWGDHSGWDTIGSLHPLRQPRVYIQVRSRALGSVLTAVVSKDDASPANVSLGPACGLDTQCWVFTEGLLKCKASKACLSVIGGKASPGARVALWSEHGRAHQKWSLNENGTISSHLSHNLVLDFKGGKGFEKDHLVASEFTAKQITQYWDIEMV